MRRQLFLLATLGLTLLPTHGNAGSRPAAAPLDADTFLPVELECPSYGAGELTLIFASVGGKQYVDRITYSNWKPVAVEQGERQGQNGTLALNHTEDVSGINNWDWLSHDPSRAEIERVLTEININSAIAIENVTPIFNQVCNGDEGFKARYYKFLRRNRSDLDAAPGAPLHNAQDPTLE